MATVSQQAHQFAFKRRVVNARQITHTTWQYFRPRLREYWSPEHISNFAAISPETIYQLHGSVARMKTPMD